MAERAMAESSWLGAGLSAIGLVVVVAAGSWWTGSAVSEGRMAAMLVRFTASVVGGLYYLTLWRVATGRGLVRR